MKKQAFIYLSGLVLFTLVGVAIGRASKRVLKSDSILNVICDDKRKTATLALELHSERDIWKLSQAKIAVFNVHVEKVGENSEEPKTDKNA